MESHIVTRSIRPAGLHMEHVEFVETAQDMECVEDMGA
jgi:hypothetical protein